MRRRCFLALCQKSCVKFRNLLLNSSLLPRQDNKFLYFSICELGQGGSKIPDIYIIRQVCYTQRGLKFLTRDDFVLTKKRMALLTAFMSGVYFILIWVFLPESVIGPRSQNMFFLMSKVGFLGLTAAFTTAITVIIIFKNDFVKAQIATFNRFKYLLFFLVKRDFVTRYRRSVLGVLWSMLNPLLTMIVMAMVFSYLFRTEIEYFPLYLLGGLIIFNFFSESTTMAMSSITSAGGIIKKVYVPKYIFPVSRVISSLVNMLFSLIAFILVFLALGAPLRFTMLLIPIPIIYTFIFSLGIGMILSSMTVFFRDITYLYGVFTLLLLYMSAIFYPVSILPESVQQILGLNPLHHYISYFRHLTLYGTVPGLWANAVCIGFAMAALCGGIYVSMSQQDKYILYL